MALHAYPFVYCEGFLLNEVFSLAVIFKITHFQLCVIPSMHTGLQWAFKETKTFLCKKYFITIFMNYMTTCRSAAVLIIYDSDTL